MSDVSLNKISKKFDTSDKQIIDNFSLFVNKGEFVVFLGPNGSGKTTLIKLIAGIESVDSGNILINNKSNLISKIGCVFQDYERSMLPWRTVEGNVRLALEEQKINKGKKEQIILDLLIKTGLHKHKDKFFYELSGGLKQLNAICRAFAYDPDILIFDEPFSSLDPINSKKMWKELMDLWKKEKKTTLFISHDIDEAIFLADKIVILSSDPLGIKKVVDVNFKRPRNLSMLSETEFNEIRKNVLELIYDEN